MLLTDVRVSAFTFIFLNYPYNGFFVSNVFCWLGEALLLWRIKNNSSSLKNTASGTKGRMSKTQLLVICTPLSFQLFYTEIIFLCIHNKSYRACITFHTGRFHIVLVELNWKNTTLSIYLQLTVASNGKYSVWFPPPLLPSLLRWELALVIFSTCAKCKSLFLEPREIFLLENPTMLLGCFCCLL